MHTMSAADAVALLRRVFPWPGDRPWNFVLHDGGSRRVDLHLYEPRPDNVLHYGSALDGVTFPAAALTGRGRIAGTDVACEAPEWSLRWHTGYPPRACDRHDIARLCERFDLPTPEKLPETAKGPHQGSPSTDGVTDGT